MSRQPTDSEPSLISSSSPPPPPPALLASLGAEVLQSFHDYSSLVERFVSDCEFFSAGCDALLPIEFRLRVVERELAKLETFIFHQAEQERRKNQENKISL